MFRHLIRTTFGLLSKKSRACKGQAIVEAAATVIMTAAMMGVLTGVSYYLYVQQALITAARDAARVASVSSGLSETVTQEAAKTQVVTYVKDYIEDTLGQTVASQAVTVTPPDPAGVQGARQVTVEIAYDLETLPVVGALLSSYAGHFGEEGGGGGHDSFPIYAKATVRYEE